MPNTKGASNTPKEERDEWRTLPALYTALDKEFKFGYDFAATKENRLATVYFSKEKSELRERNALETDKWFVFGNDVAYLNTSGFLNPPFSKIGEFLARASKEIVIAGKEFGNPVIVCLVKADSPEATWWRDNVLDSDGYIKHEVRYLYPRLPYCNPNGEVKASPRFASALIIMRPTPWRHVRWVNWKQYAGVT